MSIEATLVCDNCGAIIHAARTAERARNEAREQCGYRRKKGDDTCFRCLTINSEENRRE